MTTQKVDHDHEVDARLIKNENKYYAKSSESTTMILS
jgi:hypothetical protein